MDPEALGIPDYRQVISHPMDLGTVCSRLAPGAQLAGTAARWLPCAGVAAAPARLLATSAGCACVLQQLAVPLGVLDPQVSAK